MGVLRLSVLGMLACGSAMAQQVIDLQPAGAPHTRSVTAPPSVDAGVANGVAKRSGAPSVGDGRANGVVKDAGAPSVGNGVANGVVKSTTVNQ